MVSWYTSSHSDMLVDPSYFSIPDGLKFRGQRTLFKSREKALTPFIASSFYGMVSVGLIVVRTIVVIVPFIASFVLYAVSLLCQFSIWPCASLLQITSHKSLLY
jgi:hypothetical protein